jgi:hypothetical protein
MKMLSSRGRTLQRADNLKADQDSRAGKSGDVIYKNKLDAKLPGNM